MRRTSEPPRETSEPVVKNIGKATRKRYAAGERLRSVPDGRRDGIAQSRYDSGPWGYDKTRIGRL